MSYQVLARKWRPKQFTEMVGQGHVLKALVNALDDDRLHHAYLFTGTRGVGKTSIARLFAKALNCEKGVSSTPCGHCSACVEISEGRFVDLIEVDAASRTKVEDTRELLENVQYAPTRGRFKVYLIDEVHMLSKSSFNALLKTLEEPPPHVKFLLATTDPQKLPVTVLSRCLQFNLKNMIPQRIVEHLSVVLTAEEIPFDEAALWLLARSADGSMRDALSLTDQSIAFGAGSINEADVRVMLGTIDLRLVYQMLSSLIQGNGVALLKSVDDLAQFSPDYNTVLGDVVSLLHRIAIAQTVPAALDNSMGDKQQVIELAAQLSAEDVQLFYQIALMGRKDLPYVPDAREGLEMTLMRMLAFRPASSAHTKIKPLNGEVSQLNEQVSSNSTSADVNTNTEVQSGSQEIEVQKAEESLANARSSEPVNEVLVSNTIANEQSAANLTRHVVEDIQANELPVNENSIGASSSASSAAAIITNVELDNSQQLENTAEINQQSMPGSDVASAMPNYAVVTEVESATGIELPVAEKKTSNIDQVVLPATIDAIADSAPLNVSDSASQSQSSIDKSTVSVPLNQQASTHKAAADQEPPTASYVDVPPWENDYQQYAQGTEVKLEQSSEQSTNSPVRQSVEIASNKAAKVESFTSQINITNMLAEPVKGFEQLGLDDWPALVGAIGFTGMTAHIAENLSLEAIEGYNIHFNVSQVQKNVLDETQKERIQTLLSQYFSVSVQVAYDSEHSTRETPWQCFEKLRAKKLRIAIATFQEDTMVQQIAGMFSGEIDRSSILPVD